MLTPYLETDLLILESILIMPIYLIILSVIWINRHLTVFQSHFYTLIFSLAIADFFTIFFYVFLISVRYWNIGGSLLIALEPYGSARFINITGPQLLMTRDIGIVLITFNRYLIVCWPSSKAQKFVSNLSPLKLALFHWGLSFLAFGPAILLADSYFINHVDFFTTVYNETYMKIAVTCTLLAIFSGILITVVMYIAIFRYLWMFRKLERGVRKIRSAQEIRFGIHVLAMSTMMFISFSLSCYVVLRAKWVDEPTRRRLSLLYPLISCNLSFVNPIFLIFLNTDVQQLFRVKLWDRKVTPMLSIT